MNTNKLKKFAQETRRKLLKQVNGKLEHVLTAETGELREKAHIIKDLRKDLDRMGREALVDKVAYTWFNRFVALRYMDVRGFQPLEVSVLTPKEGQVSPEILQEAMAGHIPDDLKVDRQKVMDLLDGRIESSNAENDAFRLLLVGVCNHLHHIFPFLFERIDDYSELLLPDDLTSEFSIIQDVIDGMVDEDCQEVEVLGWLYQFYISEKKDEVFASKGKVKKEEIPAATQLFTPRWIVEYMVQNTVGKLWVLNHPNSKLKEQMPYYIESEVTAEDVLTIDKPEELTLLDQACGSGHILVYGFELLYKIYEEEGYTPSDIPQLIIEHNLHGFEIDERAAQLAGLAILMKARETQRRFFRKTYVPEPNITCFEDLQLKENELEEFLSLAKISKSNSVFKDLILMTDATNYGSLIKPLSTVDELKKAREKCEVVTDLGDIFEFHNQFQVDNSLDILIKLAKKYCCIVDNPPYMGSRNMNKELSGFVKSAYPDSKSDLMASFMECGLNSLKEYGLIGMINQHSWMFLSSYEKLREKLIEETFVDTLLHLGPRTFPEIGGEVVQNTSFTILKKRVLKKGSYIRLVEFNNPKQKEIKLLEAINNSSSSYFYNSNQKDFKKIAGSPIGYWISNAEVKAFEQLETVGDVMDVKVGLQTGNNDLFLRYWHEISINKSNLRSHSHDKKWFTYNKGGGFRKWYGNIFHVVNWENNGLVIKNYKDSDGKLRSRPQNIKFYFLESITWSDVSTGKFSCRYSKKGAIFDVKGSSGFSNDIYYDIGLLNSEYASSTLFVLNPTMSYQVSNIKNIPYRQDKEEIVRDFSKSCISISMKDWDSRETSWDFQQNELIRFNKEGGIETLEEAYDLYKQYWQNKFYQLHQNEEELNQQFIEIYGLQEELTSDVPLNEITILQEELDRKKLKKKESEFRSQNSEVRKPELPFKDKEVMAQFVSYAVGCMFGRYSLDQEGLILANQGETLEDYLRKVSLSKNEVAFLPDDHNIIPVLDDEWFEDDIVARFHEFLKSTFEESHFQKNLQFVEEMLGHDVRKYFDKYFYKDHYKRYNKRPIYWKFSSPKGSFSVLIYMHRYTPDTLNNILNNYLREFINKLETRKEQMQHLQTTGSASEKAQADKEVDKLNAMIKDCEEYEREILYPLASERIEMDLDDGVLVNYNLFGKAVEEIKSVNDKKKKKKVKEFDWIDGSRIR